MAISLTHYCGSINRSRYQIFWSKWRTGIAQSQYAQTGRINPRKVPSIMLQAFISLWSGAAVGPEGPLTFLTGGFGTYLSDRLRLKKDDVQVLVYSSIAEVSAASLVHP